MRLLTKPVQTGADYVVIDLAPDYVNWLLDVRRELMRLAEQRPQNKCLWTVFESSTHRFLLTQNSEFTLLSEFDEEIRKNQFVQLPDFIVIPDRVPLPPPPPQPSGMSALGDVSATVPTAGQNAAPPPPTDRSLDIATDRLYVTICAEGLAWHANVTPSSSSYGQRALTTPRLEFAAAERLFGIRAAEPVAALPGVEDACESR